ncbi:hypothetical protein C8J56DRAFT_849604, partial [Mycena floridula]
MAISARTHPTLEGKNHTIETTITAKTQYKLQASSMPKEITKRLNDIQHSFVWGKSKSSSIGIDILASTVHHGGKSMRIMHTQNEAADIVRLKTYLNMGEDCPTCTAFLPDVFQHGTREISRNTTDGVKDDACSNLFLQTWNTAPFRLPLVLERILSTAKKYGVEFDGNYLSPEVLNEMPIWHHLRKDPKRTQYNNRATDICLRAIHRVFSV